MNKEQLKINIENMEKELKEMKSQLNKSENKRWRAEKYYGCYYCCDSDGEISSYRDINKFDDFHYDTGNYFETEEEAKQHREKLLAQQELLDLCDWEEGNVFEICYFKKDNKFDRCCSSVMYSPYRFKSEESVKKAIKQLGKNKLKLIFNINE